MAVNLNEMTVKYVLRGNKLYKKFDKELLQSYIDLMTPYKASFMRLCSGIVNSSHKACQKEKWFGTKYRVKEIPNQWLKEVSLKDGKSLRFHFPEPNKFLAKNFELKKPKDPENPIPDPSVKR